MPRALLEDQASNKMASSKRQKMGKRMDTDTTTNGHEEEHADVTIAAMAVTPQSTSTGSEIGSQEWIKKVKASLRQLQPPMSTLDRVLFELGDEIRQRRDAGCSTSDLAKFLSGNGVVITGPALARYLRNGSKTTAKTRKVPALRESSTT